MKLILAHHYTIEPARGLGESSAKGLGTLMSTHFEAVGPLAFVNGVSNDGPVQHTVVCVLIGCIGASMLASVLKAQTGKRCATSS